MLVASENLSEIAGKTEQTNMKTYLVTGAAGFIGANYLKYILAKHETSG